MKFQLFSVLSSLLITVINSNQENVCHISTAPNCVTFTVSQGTGCAWMCNYCASKLGTSNYYFTDNVCKYVEGTGCVGTPYAGVSYTCCSSVESL